MVGVASALEISDNPLSHPTSADRNSFHSASNVRLEEFCHDKTKKGADDILERRGLNWFL
jgi:hypothetical protein